MLQQECPTCKSGRLTWDARSQVFLCLAPNCSAFFKPRVEGKSDREVGVLISRGQLSVNPAWFTAQSAGGGVARRA